MLLVGKILDPNLTPLSVLKIHTTLGMGQFCLQSGHVSFHTFKLYSLDFQKHSHTYCKCFFLSCTQTVIFMTFNSLSWLWMTY